MLKRNSFLTLLVRVHVLLCVVYIVTLFVGCGYSFYQATAGSTQIDESLLVAFIIACGLVAFVSVLLVKWCKITNGAIQYAEYMWPVCPRFDLLIKHAKSGNVDGKQFFTGVLDFKKRTRVIVPIIAITTAVLLIYQPWLEKLITIVFWGFEAIIFVSMFVVGYLCANWTEA